MVDDHQAGVGFESFLYLVRVYKSIFIKGHMINFDPIQGKGTDLPVLKQATAGRMALWGGVSGSLTVEVGTAEETVRAVREAIDALAPGGGFVLSPVDNVRDETPQSWPNVRAFIDACHQYGRYA